MLYSQRLSLRNKIQEISYCDKKGDLIWIYALLERIDLFNVEKMQK